MVEKKLKKDEGLSRHDLGREEFMRRVWQWKVTPTIVAKHPLITSLDLPIFVNRTHMETVLPAKFDVLERLSTGPGLFCVSSQITHYLMLISAYIAGNRESFTMDANLSRAVTEAFVRFHEDGLLYRCGIQKRCHAAVRLSTVQLASQ